MDDHISSTVERPTAYPLVSTDVTARPAGGARVAGSPVVLGLAGGFVVFALTAVALSAAVGNVRGGSVSLTAAIAGMSAVVSWTLVLLYHTVPKPAARVAAIFMAFLVWA